MRKGKGLKVTALIGAVSTLFAGAALAAAPRGFNAGNFSASGGTISSNCSSLADAANGFSASCSPPIANGFGFLQEIVTIKDSAGNATDYIHTVVTDQSATFSAGSVGSGQTTGFTDETLVKFTTNQGVQTSPNQNGIWGQQHIFEEGTTANLNTNFTSKTELAMGWANPTGVDAVQITQAVEQATTRGAGTIGDRFKTTFDYFADVVTDSATNNTTRTGYSTNIAQLVGLNNAPNGTEGDIQSFRLMQVSGTRNVGGTTTGRLPLMAGMSSNSVSLDGAATATNQAMWLGQKISVTSTASMEFGYQSFDNLGDGQNPAYYYNLSSAQPATVNGSDAWTAAGKFNPAPTLNNPKGGSGIY